MMTDVPNPNPTDSEVEQLPEVLIEAMMNKRTKDKGVMHGIITFKFITGAPWINRKIVVMKGDNVLSYYMDGILKGQIDLRNTYIIPVPPVKADNRENVFGIYKTKSAKEAGLFEADSAATRDLWVKTLSDLVASFPDEVKTKGRTKFNKQLVSLV
jgi:hypothetical protein